MPEFKNFSSTMNSSWEDPHWSQKAGSGNVRWQKIFLRKEHEMVKVKGPVESTVPAHKSSANKQNKDKKKECFVCHKLGHFANRCPEKAVEIHHINVGPVYNADAKVGGKLTNVIIDSGANVSNGSRRFVIEPAGPGST